VLQAALLLVSVQPFSKKETLMEILFVIVVIGVLTGLLGIGLMEHLRGPMWFRILSHGVLLLEGIGYGLFGRMAGVSGGMAVLSIFITAGVLATYRLVWRRNLLRLATGAPLLRDFALKHFDELDVDGDGTITKLDVFNAKPSLMPTLSPEDQLLLTRLDQYMWFIGHVTDSLRTVSPMSGTVVYLHHYGITRDDLAAWPRKAHRQMDLDFGCVCKKQA
jgi:hypothetical protein